MILSGGLFYTPTQKMSTSKVDKAAIEKRYREYCDVCQSGQLERLTEFWSLPAVFIIDYGEPETIRELITTASELEELYGNFGFSSGIDRTEILSSEVSFFGSQLATIETTLRHTVKGKLHDQQHASYGCRKVDGKWSFISHISSVENAAN